MERKKLNLEIDELARGELIRMKDKLALPTEGDVVRVACGLLAWALEKRDEGYLVGAFGADGKPNLEAFTPKADTTIEA